MKKLIILLLLALIPSSAQTWGPVMMSGGVASGGGGSDAAIVFYFNCNANTNNQTPTKGSGPITYTSDFSVVTGVLGNALSTSGTSAGYAWNIPTSSNLNFAVGTIGFYWRASTITPSATVLFSGDASEPYFWLYAIDATTLDWRYKSGYQTFTVAADTTYYIELSWDGTAEKQSYRVNGGSWVETTGLTGSNPSASDLAFGSYITYLSTFWVDQVMIANTYQKDLYNVRTSTNP